MQVEFLAMSGSDIATIKPVLIDESFRIFNGIELNAGMLSGVLQDGNCRQYELLYSDLENFTIISVNPNEIRLKRINERFNNTKTF